MLCTTQGIVLHTIPYNDTYAIIHTYTKAYGRASYLAARTRSRKSKVSPALFSPLSALEMVVDHKNNREIQRIIEVKACFTQSHISSHPVKNAIALFIAELLFRITHAKEADEKLFEYLYRSIHYLEISERGVANFHLAFLLNLTRFLGIYPLADSYQAGSFFDLLNGTFTSQPPSHRYYLTKDESTYLIRLLRLNYGNMPVYAFSGQERSLIIQRIIEYYRLHLHEFPEIKSLAILQTLFS